MRKLVLAEPGGFSDDSFGDIGGFMSDQAIAHAKQATDLIAAGDIDAGLAYFIDGLSGMSIWAHTVSSFKNMARANARTLLGQIREIRPTLTRADMESLKKPTLLVGGALTPPPFPQLLDLLEAHIINARRLTIPGARHAMNLAAPMRFNAEVLAFLG